MSHDRYRGTGRTTRQMKEAPKGALFIWCTSNDTLYPRALARDLDREDLVIIRLPRFASEIDQHRGRRYPAVIVDHAAARHMTDRIAEYIEAIRAYCVREPA